MEQQRRFSLSLIPRVEASSRLTRSLSRSNVSYDAENDEHSGSSLSRALGKASSMGESRKLFAQELFCRKVLENRIKLSDSDFANVAQTSVPLHASNGGIPHRWQRKERNFTETEDEIDFNQAQIEGIVEHPSQTSAEPRRSKGVRRRSFVTFHASSSSSTASTASSLSNSSPLTPTLSTLSPSSWPSSSIVIEEFAPDAFRVIRFIFGYRFGSFAKSLGSAPLVGMGSGGGGRSGAQFYVSEDRRYVIKSLPADEVTFLMQILPEYITFVTANSFHTLLPRFLGLYRIKYPRKSSVAWIVMPNLFRTHPSSSAHLVEFYDLKGSRYQRYVASFDANAPGAAFQDDSKHAPIVLKDLNFCPHHGSSRPLIQQQSASKARQASDGATAEPQQNVGEGDLVDPKELEVSVAGKDLCRKLRLGAKRKSVFLESIRKDTEWLCDRGIMDFSLLLGIGHCSKSMVLQERIARKKHQEMQDMQHQPENNIYTESEQNDALEEVVCDKNDSPSECPDVDTSTELRTATEGPLVGLLVDSSRPIESDHRSGEEEDWLTSIGTTRRFLNPPSYWEEDLGGTCAVSKDMGQRVSLNPNKEDLPSPEVEVNGVNTDDNEKQHATNTSQNDQQLCVICEDETADAAMDQLEYYKFGLIDILQRYNMRKRTEHVIKVRAMGNKSHEISSIKPVLYRERFRNFFERHTE